MSGATTDIDTARLRVILRLSRRIHSLFPEPPMLPTSDLLRLTNDARPPPLLLDARTATEYRTSHMKNAYHFTENPPPLPPSPHAPVVFYCTAGLRSAIAARRFRRRYPACRVWNSEGVLAYVHAGGKLVKGDGAVEEARIVHVFDRGLDWAPMGWETTCFSKIEAWRVSVGVVWASIAEILRGWRAETT